MRRLPVPLLLVALGCAGPVADEFARCATGSTSAPASDPLVRGLAAGDASRGADLFQVECTRCHSPRVVDRGSRLFRGYPRLDCSGYPSLASPDYLATVILRGGPAVGLDEAMRPFAEKLSQEDVADLIAFLRGGSEPGAAN